MSGDVVSLNADVAWVFVAVYPLDRGGPDPLVVTVYQTLDGGGHWNAGAPFEAEHAIADMPMFIDRLHGWLLPWTGEETGREHRQLWRTTDGGRTWELLTTTEEPEGVPTGCSKNGLAFASERVGLMTGVCPGPFFLYKTSDGGATWFPHPVLPVPEELPADAFQLADSSSSSAVYFPDGAGYFLVTLGALYSPSSQRLLYTTRDSGDTWTPYLLPDETFYPRLITPDHGWGVSGQRHEKLFVTVNGGKDWEYVGLMPNNDSTLHNCQIDFVDLQHGWCLDGGVLFSTVDGGNTWQRLEPVLASAS